MEPPEVMGQASSHLLSRVWTDLLLGTAVRVVIGSGLGMIVGLVGYFAGIFFLTPTTGLDVSLAILITSSGIGAGMGASVGWVDLDGSPATNAVVLALAVSGGVIGAWAGLLYVKLVQQVALTADETRTAGLVAGVVVANLFPAAAVLYKGARRFGSAD